jgi:tight adherence protein C
MWLSDLVTRRQSKVKKELPFALDLLTLSVEAGQDFTAAMATIVEKLQNSPLSQEFDQVYKEINMGRQRAEALRDMSGRLNMFEVNNVVSALVQADELGTGLGRVLRIQAEEVRRRRFEAAEKRAQQAPVKMLFPLVVFIFPATMLTIASPLIITFIRALLRGTGFRWF